MVKPKGHSESQIYNNHDKAATDIPSGFEFVAEQIEHAGHAVKRLERHMDIMSGKGEGDLTNMSKARQNMWFNYGYNYLTSGKLKEQMPSYSLSDKQYDRFVRKGISAEFVGSKPGKFLLDNTTSYGRKRVAEAKAKKQKRIS